MRHECKGNRQATRYNRFWLIEPEHAVFLFRRMSILENFTGACAKHEQRTFSSQRQLNGRSSSRRDQAPPDCLACRDMR
jgi:hypothetical protein